MYLLAICMSLEKCLFGFCPFFDCSFFVVVVLILNCMSYLYSLDINPLLVLLLLSVHISELLKFFPGKCLLRMST